MADSGEKVPCPLCDAGIIGRMWSRDIILARKTAHEAAMFFKCDAATVMRHVNDHELVVDEEGVVDSPDFYMRKLGKLLKTLDDWVNYVTGRAPDPTTINLGIKLSREIRATLETLAVFQGRLGGQTQVNVQIDNMNMKYLQLTQIIQEKVCDQCRARILEVIDVASEDKSQSMPLLQN